MDVHRNIVSEISKNLEYKRDLKSFKYKWWRHDKKKIHVSFNMMSSYNKNKYDEICKY